VALVDDHCDWSGWCKRSSSTPTPLLMVGLHGVMRAGNGGITRGSCEGNLYGNSGIVGVLDSLPLATITNMALCNEKHLLVVR
jgi:hypothetical protein